MRKKTSKPVLRISLPLQIAARRVCPMLVVISDHWRSLRTWSQKDQRDLLNWTRQHNGSWDRSNKFQGYFWRPQQHLNNLDVVYVMLQLQELTRKMNIWWFPRSENLLQGFSHCIISRSNCRGVYHSQQKTIFIENSENHHCFFCRCLSWRGDI